jgi:leucyl aminopeptidase
VPVATAIGTAAGTVLDSAADIVAIPVDAGEHGPSADLKGSGLSSVEFDARLPGPFSDLARMYDMTGAAGEAQELPVDWGSGLRRLVLLGVGGRTPDDLRKAGAAVARKAKGRRQLAVVALGGDGPGSAPALTAFVEGLLLAGYRFSYAEPSANSRPLAAVELLTERPREVQEGVDRGRALAEATALARDLTNTPSATKDPGWVAEQARGRAAQSGLAYSEWDAEALAREGFGGILAVGGGSPRPPRLVRLDYAPPEARRHVVLVGKGITFDTGGLSLKPNDNMKLMKTDMGGAAVVLSVLSGLAALGAPVRVTGLLPLAENAFSGGAQRPGDVLTTYSGRTVEVLNTDAEGRLVLADALGYAVQELDPDEMVDVATLTGAAKVALGTGTGALFATDDALAAALLDGGRRAGEPLWRLPLSEVYADSLQSSVADLANIGTIRAYGPPGATEAALFLREFTGTVPWAHLDIAGPARATSDNGVITKGATGFATRLLLRWLAE